MSFAAAQTTKTVSVTVVGDAAPEVNETFYVVLDMVTGATIKKGPGIGTIVNDDPALLSATCR